MKHLQWKNLLLVAYVFYIYIFLGIVLFLKERIQEFSKDDRNKLFVRNKTQIDNHTLMLDMLNSHMSVVFTCHCRGVFKKIFRCGCCSLLIFVAKKLLKALNFNFYVHKAPSNPCEMDFGISRNS